MSFALADNEPAQADVCEHCGHKLVRWPDVVEALEQNMRFMPAGYRSLIRQTIDEIHSLRARVK